MSLRAVLVFVSIIAIGILNNSPSGALTPTDPTSEKYLIDHGHSQEIVRMINLQKERTEGKVATPSQSQNKIKKFFKNIWFEQDLTMPGTDFGYSNIKTVETDKSIIPSTVELINSKIKEKCKNKDPNEININDIKIRKTE